MGNHWGSGREKESAGACAIAVRAVAASAVVAVSLFAANLPSDGGHAAGAASGSVGPAGLVPAGEAPGAPVQGDHTGVPWTGAVGQADLTGLSGGFVADARALVPFSRTIVRTIAKDGQPELNVASAGLPRPPVGFLMAPLEVLNSSSPFGPRVSPLTGAGGDFHLGQDYAAACGTRVYAADSGAVRAAGWHPWGGGNRVEIDHGNGLITTYNHLEAIAVETGDSVQVGQVIARVGTTGWSTGCHLHFETILHGKHTSPLNWRLIPISQMDRLAAIAMISFANKPPASDRTPNWAIPAAPGHNHTVLGGEDELPVAPTPEEGTAPPAGTPGPEPSPPAASTPDPSDSPAPTPTDTPTETGSPMPTDTPTETGSPTVPVTTAPVSPSASPPGTPTVTGTPAAPTSPPAPTVTVPTADPRQAPGPPPSPDASPGAVSSPGLPPEPGPAAEPSATEMASREAQTPEADAKTPTATVSATP